MTHRHYIILVLFLFFSAQWMAGQVSFVSSDVYVDDVEMNSGAPMGIADVNGDGLDDIIVLDEALDLYVIYQTEGHKNMAPQMIERVSNQRNWCLGVTDVDQLGGQDIFVGGSQRLMIYRTGPTLDQYTGTQVVTPSFLTQGMSFADMDDDGDIDLFVCDDDAENFIAYNDGNGNFVEVNNVMDFSTDPPSDGSGNYGSVFSDYDRDGDLDLYISKCRLGTQPGDPERTNQFFEKTDTGFVRNYDFPEILSNDQSWVSDFVDVDNDGDFDLFVANHGAPMNLFIRQEDGSYVDEAVSRGVAFEAGVIQLVSGDFDNDGDVDMFVPGSDHIMFLNDGNGYFIDAGFPEADDQIESASCGDLNNDGRLDIYAGYARIYNSPTDIADKIFWNNTAAGNFIKFSLRGNTPNRFALGAKAEIFRNGKSQLREIRAGESYGINKTNIVHFGLGNELLIDSVVIYWPSGAEEKYVDLDANTIYQVREGIGVYNLSDQSIQTNAQVLCAEDSITLTGPPATIFRWSNGATEQSIVVKSPGVYTLEIFSSDQWITLPSYQVVLESTEPPHVTLLDGSMEKCMAEAVTLTAGEPNEYVVTWNSGSMDATIQTSTSGAYYFTEERVCGTYNSDTLLIENIEVVAPLVQNDTVALNNPATLTSNSTETVWKADTTQEVIQTGPSFTIGSLVADSIVFAAVPEVIERGEMHVGIEEPGQNDGYHNVQLSTSVFFETYENIKLNSLTVYARQAGLRSIIIEDVATEVEIYRESFDITVGQNTLLLNVDLERDKSYEIKTDPDENIMNLGFPSPDFIRSAGMVNYPIVSDYMAITESGFGTGQYYYFYDWVVKPEDKICYSYWQPAFAIVDDNSSTSSVVSTSIQVAVYPNPANDQFTVLLDDRYSWESIEVVNSNGATLFTHLVTGNEMKIINQNFQPGMLFLKVNRKDGFSIYKKILVY